VYLCKTKDGVISPILNGYPKASQEMNLDLKEEHIAVRDAARDFAQNVLKPTIIERDNAQRFATEEIRQLGELGFMGMMVDEEYGGSGMDTVSYVLAMEEISKVDASVSVCMRLKGIWQRISKEKIPSPFGLRSKNRSFLFV
jgi:hypothetical protein